MSKTLGILGRVLGRARLSMRFDAYVISLVLDGDEEVVEFVL